MSRPRLTPERAEELARENFQKAIKFKLVELDFSQRELADMVGLSQSWISRRLADPYSIDIGLLRRIVHALRPDPLVILALVGYTDKEIKQLRDRLAA